MCWKNYAGQACNTAKNRPFASKKYFTRNKENAILNVVIILK